MNKTSKIYIAGHRGLVGSALMRQLQTQVHSICPLDSPKPIKEEYLLTGSLEPTNRPYALAKIAVPHLTLL